MRNIFTIMLCLLFYGTTHAQFTFATADTMGEGVTKTGTVWANGAIPTPYHYYKPILRGYGMMRIVTRVTNTHLTDGSSVLLGVYNRDGILYKNKGIGLAPNTTVNDTFWVTGIQPDSIYIRMEHSGVNYGGPFNYTIKYELFNVLPNDEKEPNNSLATAHIFMPGDSVNGHISYRGTAYYLDENDYYKLVVPKDGNIKLTFSWVNLSVIPGWTIPAASVYSRDRNGNFVSLKRTGSANSGLQVIANNGNTLPGTRIYDTMTIYGRAKDTLNIAFYNFFSGYGIAYAGAYTMKYTMFDTSVINEKEINDVTATAQFITPNDTVKANIGYTAGYYTDQFDYYKIVKPKGGDVKIYISAINRYGYDATVTNPQVSFWDKAGWSYNVTSATGAVSGSLLLRSVWQQPYNMPIADTMTVKCVSSDTAYIRVYAGQSFQYTLRYEYVAGPDARMAYSRVGNEFGFTNLSKYATNYRWIMGNGNQHTTTYPPMTTYVPGFYTAKLVAYDNMCNISDTDAQSFTITGIEYYTPKSSGKGGDLAFEIYGGGLDTATKIRFVQGSTVLTPSSKYSNTKKNHLTAIMDLHFAAAGLYDVIIEVPGQAPVTYANGFRVEALKYPVAWSQVVAPWAWRINTDNRFKLVVGNNGNIMASGVVVAMVWPKTTQVTWLGKQYKPDYTKDDTLYANSKRYIVPNEHYRYIYDSTEVQIPIDSFEGQPFDGYVRYFRILHIPAGGTIELPFIARASTAGAQPFITYTHRPNLLGSCPPGTDEDFANARTAEMIDWVDGMSDKTKIPLFKAFTKTAKIGQKHMQSMSSYLGKEFWAWYDGYETDHAQNEFDLLKENEANNQFARETAMEELGNAVIDAGVARSAKALNGQIDGLNKIMANNPNMSTKDFDQVIDQLNAAGGGLNRLDRLKQMFDMAKDMKGKKEKLESLLKAIDDCPELKEQADALKDMINDELTHQGKSRNNSNSVASMDPNNIYGPDGVEAPRYVNNLQRQPFLVTFENMDTASADAQEVTIIDTLDKTKFNLSSFAFGEVVIANKAMRVPGGRYEFSLQGSVPNVKGMLVRVSGRIDTATGIATWHFSSVDSLTGNRPPLYGFLRPNKSKPEGEGSVSYTVEPLNTLPDATALTSTAHIIFDDNAPIATDTWLNTVDINAPVSRIASAVANDTIITLKMTGTDAASGIRSYRIYAATNGGAWKYLSLSTSDSMVVRGEHDSTYAFYCLAVDGVENRETKTATAEVTITMPAVIRSQHLSAGALRVYPNPASTQVTIQTSIKGEEQVTIELYSIMGQKVATLYEGKLSGNNIINSNLQQIAGGVYTIQLTTARGEKQTGKLVIAR